MVPGYRTGLIFATLNLPRESMEALTELRDAAMYGQLTKGFVEEITRRFGLGKMSRVRPHSKRFA